MEDRASIQRAHDRLDKHEVLLSDLRDGQESMKLEQHRNHAELKEMLSSQSSMTTSEALMAGDRFLGIVFKGAALFGLTVGGILYLASNINAVDIAKLNEKVQAFTWSIEVRKAE